MQFFATWKGESKPNPEPITLNLQGAKRPEALIILPGTNSFIYYNKDF